MKIQAIMCKPPSLQQYCMRQSSKHYMHISVKVKRQLYTYVVACRLHHGKPGPMNIIGLIINRCLQAKDRIKYEYIFMHYYKQTRIIKNLKSE